jgi:ATP sulfurylase
LNHWRLPDGRIWPIPITLPVTAKVSRQLKVSRLAALVYQGTIVGGIHVEDVFWLEPRDEAERLYGTTDPSHPGVARCLTESPIRVAGAVTMIGHAHFDTLPVLSPRAMRQAIEHKGWRTVVAFQTRNPLHRAHEYIQKCALEWVDGLVIHPLIGLTKADDVPALVRWQSYRTLIERYYPRSRVLLSGFPAAMRYAGPREAVLHAIARKNYGFTHFIVGRDHAGVGNFYHPLAAQQVFQQFPDLGISILTPAPAFYCPGCGQLATERTCPHDPEQREALSGTRVRSALQHGEALPAHLIRPDVAGILSTYYQT